VNEAGGRRIQLYVRVPWEFTEVKGEGTGGGGPAKKRGEGEGDVTRVRE